jgi:hypothetical protein
MTISMWIDGCSVFISTASPLRYYLQTAFLTLIGHAEYIYSTLLFILPPLVVLVIIMGQNREMTFIYQNMIPLIRVYFFGFFYNIIL